MSLASDIEEEEEEPSEAKTLQEGLQTIEVRFADHYIAPALGLKLPPCAGCG